MVYRRKTYGKNKKQKRWYFDATIGKNVPIIGGTGLRMGTGALGKRSLAAAVKTIVRRGIEATHYKIFNGNTSNTTLQHSTLYTMNLMGNIPRGDNWDNRNGDIIHISCIELNLKLIANGTNNLPNDILVKYWVIRDEDEYLNASDAISSGVGSNKFINSPLYATEGIWDTKKVSVVTSGVHTFKSTSVSLVGGNYVSPAQTKTEKVLICPNAKYVYETQTNFGKNPNYYLVVTASSPNAITNLCYIFVDGMIKFKNSQ
jgi:hypothetical protein